MEIIRDITEVRKRTFPHVAAAIGTFDGVHTGHQRIIRKVVERSRLVGGTGAVFTFSNHPLAVLDPARAPKLITPSPIKERILGTLGVDLVIAIPFTEALAGMEAEAFVVDILWKKLRVEFLCMGFDFGFGRGRRGTSEFLKRMASDLGFEVEVVAPEHNNSAKSNALTLHAPLYVNIAGNGFCYVNGTPADCVSLGVSQWERVDVVLSGINLGSNLGNAIRHSGTLAAAKQAALMGLRGIALSIPVPKDEPDFEALKPAVRDVLALVLDEARPFFEFKRVVDRLHESGVKAMPASDRLSDDAPSCLCPC